MGDTNRIPRWLVENDPSWEKSIDSDLGILRWTRKGTAVQATCSPTSMFCEIIGQDGNTAGLVGMNLGSSRMQNLASAGGKDITKYLSSRYLNPGISGPHLDLRKSRRT
jgi:hypothetical protein